MSGNLRYSLPRRQALIGFISIILTVALAIPAQANDGDFAIVGVDVVPMDEEIILEDQTVIVGAGRIQSISSTAATALPDGMLQIDGHGRYLMPGLADLHIHLRHEDELVNYLYWGVTTVMHLGGSGESGRQQLEFRNRIRTGDLLGPNLYTTDRVLDGDPALPRNAHRLTTEGDARRVVRELKANGFDFVKIYNNVSRPVFEAIVDEASTLGLPVVGHIPRNFDPLISLSGGQDAIAHTEELFFTYFEGPRSTDNMRRDYEADLDKLPALIEVLVENDVATMPDLSFTFTDMIMWDGLEALWNDPEFPYLRPDTASSWQAGNINRREEIENFIVREQLKYSLIQELTLRFQQAGILQVIGTDASLPGLFPGKAVHRELTELVKAGLSNFDALAAGSRNAGEFVRRYVDADVRFGLVKPGYRADFVLLDENPLEDVRNARMVSAVSVAGRYVPKARLDERRAALRARYEHIHAVMNDVDTALSSAQARDRMEALLVEHRDDAEVATMIESRLNAAGYAAAFADDLDRAERILELNTILFPGSANTWDTLAEITLNRGDAEKALKLYRKALAADPAFSNAAEQIERILAEQSK